MGKIVIPRELPDTAAILHRAFRLEQGDMSVFGHTPKNQALTHQVGNLFWREVDHGNDLFPWKLLYLIEVSNLCGGLSLAQSPKVNNQLIGWFSGLLKRFGVHYGAYPHFYFHKLVPIQKWFHGNRIVVQ